MRVCVLACACAASGCGVPHNAYITHSTHTRARALTHNHTQSHTQSHTHTHSLSLSNVKTAPNIGKMTAHFNQVSSWVATRVLTSPEDKRLEVYAKFVELLEELRVLRNYNTLAQIMAGLCNVAVQRLKPLLWEPLSPHLMGVYNTCEELLSPSNNYKSYRLLLARHMEGDTTIIPHIPLILKDLTFIEECNQDVVDSGNLADDCAGVKWNLEKLSLIGAQVAVVKKAQMRPYTFDNVNKASIALLQSPYFFSDDDLYEISLSLKELKGSTPNSAASSRHNSPTLRGSIDYLFDFREPKYGTRLELSSPSTPRDRKSVV
eukprot:TRINITY_DN223_c0_g3_i8.p2 TRINITY_DN223_c0_g3~~TRINITY_DN223_c0_g3_i8.p2  ORF type:complete len:319 (+),score=51.98 TRINITY_DN223_c0_g3_i8:897-1853(+)